MKLSPQMFLGSELADHRAKLRTSTVQEALSLQPQGIVDRTASAYPELTCLSFNLRKESDHLEARMAALLILVECIDPDFICLQENTARHEALLSTSAFIQERYVRSPFDGQGPGFKVSLYSKLPFEDLVLYHLRGRPCVTGFVTIEGRKVAVSSVHLTSGRNAGIRQKQLALLYEKTRDCETSLVFGDMNACQPGDDVSVNQEGFVDVWPALHPNEPGVTRLHSRTSGFRLDRAALRSDSYEASSIAIVGQDVVPGPPPLERVTISDHFGLVLVLRLRSSRDPETGKQQGGGAVDEHGCRCVSF